VELRREGAALDSPAKSSIFTLNFRRGRSGELETKHDPNEETP
jgi:hypothetical protein